MSRYRAPEPTIADSRFVLRGLLLLASLGALVAIGVSIVVGTSLTSGRGERLETYRNVEYGYEIRYPAAWQLEVRNPMPGDDFEAQSVRIVRDEGDLARAEWSPGVIVAVNFQAGWCESARIETRSITVSGIGGEEYVCYVPEGQACAPEPSCHQQPVMLVRHFEATAGGNSHTVLGQTEDEVDAVRRIVESFRFMN